MDAERPQLGKLYYKIKDVAEMLGVQQSTLGKFGPQLLSKIAPRNPNHWITMGDIGSALWAIPAVKTGVIRFVGGVAGSIINNY